MIYSPAGVGGGLITGHKEVGGGLCIAGDESEGIDRRRTREGVCKIEREE